jgi:HEAT repeat protein
VIDPSSPRFAEARPGGLRVIDQRIIAGLSSSSGELDPRCDERSVDELFTAALCEHDEHVRWSAVSALRWRGSAEVLQRAVNLCRSFCVVERELGADILGQLDVSEQPLRERRLAVLLRMLEAERQPRVLCAVLSAIGHQSAVEAIKPASRLTSHVEADVRFAVVMALMGQEHPVAVASLIDLTRDQNSDVRDWATFALGTQLQLDTPEIRDALAARLFDQDDDTRCEALVGLARRGDERVIGPLQKALSSAEPWSLEIEAAESIADARLYPALIAVRDRRESPDEPLEDAIRACSPR